MSLINKMLQDLDARGTPPGEAFPSQIKPVAKEPDRFDKRVLAAGVAAALAALAVGGLAWHQLHAPGTGNVAVLAKAVPVAVPAPAKAPAGMTSTITMLPAAAPPVAAAVPEPATGPAPVAVEATAAVEPAVAAKVPAKADVRPAQPEAVQPRHDTAAPKHKAAGAIEAARRVRPPSRWCRWSRTAKKHGPCAKR
jgi:MSHA biogenesis protein MshN